MYKSKALVGLILLCYVLYAIFEFSDKQLLAYGFNSCIVVFVLILYVLCVKQKNKFLLLFLIFYSLADISSFVLSIVSARFDSQKLYDFEYYFTNGLYILAYVFLIIKIISSLKFSSILKHFKIHLVVLIALNTYFLYTLHSVINPHLVIASDYYLELIYNFVVLVLLSLALLNYFYRDNKKALYLFLGTLFIVFSEVFLIANIYVYEDNILLNFTGTTLAVIAFYFIYQQSKLLNYVNPNGHFVVNK